MMFYIYSMKTISSLSTFSLLVLVIILCTQCASTPKLDKVPPTVIESAYYEKWNAGIKEGGSGNNVYIKLKDNTIQLDSIYFRGKVTKLEQNHNKNLLYVGRFISKINDSTKHSKTQLNWPFQIKNNECVVSYLVERKVQFFKILNMEERKLISYPASRSNR